MLQAKLDASRDYKMERADWLASNWKGMLPMNVEAADLGTGVDRETLLSIGRKITKLPDDFSPHRNIGKIYKAQ